MQKNANKYTLLNTFGCLFTAICKSFGAWQITIFYGALITVFSTVFELIRFCNARDVNCIVTAVSAYVLLVFIATLFYLYDFYQTVFKNSVFKMSDTIKFSKNKIKSVGILFGYFFCFVISAVISWKILLKPANPDWRIEFIYFTIFFIFCMLPFAAMRFSAFTAFYLQDCKMPSFKYLYKRTEGRSYIGIIGFLMILLILAVLNMQYHSFVTLLFDKSRFPITTGVLQTFLYVLIILFTFAVFMCFFEAQRQVLVDGDDNGKENQSAVVEAKKEPIYGKKAKIKKNKKSKKQ